MVMHQSDVSIILYFDLKQRFQAPVDGSKAAATGGAPPRQIRDRPQLPRLKVVFTGG